MHKVQHFRQFLCYSILQIMLIHLLKSVQFKRIKIETKLPLKFTTIEPAPYLIIYDISMWGKTCFVHFWVLIQVYLYFLINSMKICQRVPCVFNLFLEQLNFSKQTTPFYKNQINLAGVIILKKTLTQTCFFSLQFHKKNYVIVLFTVTFFSNIEN